MVQTVILSSSPYQHFNLLEDRVTIAPNRRAARTIGAPYQSFQMLAKKVLIKRRMRVASSLMALHLLRRAVEKETRVVDVEGTARSLGPSVRRLLRSEFQFSALETIESERARRLVKVARRYREELRALDAVDAAEALHVAAEFVTERRAVCVYGFPQLEEDELLFLDTLAGEGSVLILPYHDSPIFARNKRAARFLEQRGWNIQWTDSTPQTLGERASSAFLEETGAPEGMQACVYPHIEAEIRGVLAQVKTLLRKGLSPVQIALAASDPSVYSSTMLDVAWEYDMSIRVQHDAPLQQTRLGAWIALYLDAVRGNLPFEITLRMLRQPLGPGLSEKNWRDARRNHWSGLEEWQTAGLQESDFIWPSEESPQYYIERLKQSEEKFQLRRRCAPWARESIAYYEFQDGLAELKSHLNRRLSLAAFMDEITELLSLIPIPVQPGRGGVEFHSIDTLHGARYSHLFVLGVAEGVFPASIRDDSILDFHDREILRQAGMKFENAIETAQKEDLSVWSLLQTGSEFISLSYSKWIQNREALPSEIFNTLGLSPASPPLAPIASMEENRKAARIDSSEFDDDIFPAFQQAWRVETSREGESVYDEFDGAVGEPIDPESIIFSATQLIALGQCPFKWFARYTLHLEEPDEAEDDLSPGLEGRLCHRTLELALNACPEGADVREIALKRLEDAFHEAEKLENVSYLPAWSAQRLEILERLRLAIQGADFLHEGAAVLAVEKKFEGRWFDLRVKGIVDRIDRGPDGLIFIDYKTSVSKPSGAKDENGKANLDVQLPLYTRAAPEALYPGEVVSKAYYYSLKNAKRLGKEKSGSDTSLDEVCRQFTEFVQTMLKEGYYPVQPDVEGKACQYCPFDSICRVGVRLSRKGDVK